MSAAIAEAVVNEILAMSYPDYAERFLKIRTKNEGLRPFRMNAAQLYLHRRLEVQRARKGYVRASLLKARQFGGSTYVQGRYYTQIARGKKGVRAFILTHSDQATANIFSMARRFHENLDPRIRPTSPRPSRKRLEFPRLDSSYAVATAGAKEVGRSDTIQFFHGCVSPESIVIAPNGEPRRMGDFQIGDLVCTHTGTTAPVSFISRKRAATLRVKVIGASESIVATPEHKFWTRKGKVELGSLSIGDPLGYPVRQLGTECVSWPYRLDYGRRPGRGGVGSVGPDELEASFDLGKILGLYLAEGCLQKQTSGTPSAVCFSVHEREVERTTGWLSAFRHCWRSAPAVAPHAGSKTVTVTVYSRSFAEFVLARCGELDEKALPVEWCRNADFAHGLVVGYFAGDGGGQFDKTTRRVQAPSIRGAISFGMRDALAALGYGWAVVTYRCGAKRNGRNERAQWTARLSGPGADRLWVEMGREPLLRTRKQRAVNITIEDGYAWLPITAIENAGEQEVMDFEVDHPDHSYCLWQCASSNSEAAFWPHADDHMAGALQAVPAQGPGTEVILESTGNGQGNAFYWNFTHALAGISEFIPVFAPWFWLEEYRAPLDGRLDMAAEDEAYMQLWGLDLEQMQFRYNKIVEFGGGEAGRAKFQQEYPCTPQEAFSSSIVGGYIEAKYVVMARNKQPHLVSVFGPKIMGIDPAYTGDDRFVVFMRQGRLAVRVGRWRKLRKPQSMGRLVRLIYQFRPDVICIDAGGVGGPFYDDLMPICDSLGIQIVPVLGNEAADDPERFRRKREENAHRVREWFEDPLTPCIADLTVSEQEGVNGLDEIQADVCAPLMDWDALGRPVIETKKRILTHAVSPDNLEALMQTFTLLFDASWVARSTDDVTSLAHAMRPVNWRAV